MNRSQRGFAVWIIIAAIAALGGGLWVAKPALFFGESKWAVTSVKTTEQLISATDKQGAVIAASVTKIAEAAAETAPSPQRSFIAEESTLALTLLPRADATALIAAERRKVAVLEGHVAEARRLYESAFKDASETKRKYDDIVSAKRASDAALVEAAAAHHATTVQLLIAVAIALIALAAWGYAKTYGVGPATLGKMLHDLKSGADPTTVFDEATNHRPVLQRVIAKARKLAAP